MSLILGALMRCARSLTFLLGSAVAVVFAVGSLLVVPQAWREGRLALLSDGAEATITGGAQWRHEPVRGGSRTRYAVVYTFAGPDGALVEGRQEVSRERLDALRVAGRAGVHYLPGDPGVNAIDTGLPLAKGGLAVVFLALAGAFGAMSFGMVRVMMRVERAARAGVRRIARVSALRPMKRGSGVVQYVDWQDDQGKGGGSMFALPLGRVVAVGEAIEVLVDPVSGVTYWSDEVSPRG